MPHAKKPIKQRPRVDDESLGNPPERHGKHREGDDALPGKGSTKGGLNRYSGVSRREGAGSKHRRSPDAAGGTKANRGKPSGSPEKKSGKPFHGRGAGSRKA